MVHLHPKLLVSIFTRSRDRRAGEGPKYCIYINTSVQKCTARCCPLSMMLRHKYIWPDHIIIYYYNCLADQGYGHMDAWCVCVCVVWTPDWFGQIQWHNPRNIDTLVRKFHADNCNNVSVTLQTNKQSYKHTQPKTISCHLPLHGGDNNNNNNITNKR